MNYYKLLYRLLIVPCFVFVACQPSNLEKVEKRQSHNGTTYPEQPFLLILGISQDAGYPQAGCHKACCLSVTKSPKAKKLTTALALIDPETSKRWLFEATPDFKEQLYRLDSLAPSSFDNPYMGIFLTHAHIGHYTGLMHLGKEAMGTKNTTVYAMPGMANYLKKNGPWSQLVDLNNIVISEMSDNSAVVLTDKLSVTPFLVPHRDEFSETVGFKISGPVKNVIFIPDIDKWVKWGKDIVDVIKENDILFLDGTFYQDGEIPGRDMNLIPHPFISESLRLFKELALEDKRKVHFIHFNHTNPLLSAGSDEAVELLNSGFNMAKEFQLVPL